MENSIHYQLTNENKRSIIEFIIYLESEGSLIIENVDILNSYKSDEQDLSSNKLFVLTELKHYKTLCEMDNEDYSNEELLAYDQ